jgi:hypothetical protein
LLKFLNYAHTTGESKHAEGYGMNPGYLTLILISILLILLASGWKEQFLRDVSHKAILLFFACWFVCRWMNLTWGELKLNFSYILLLGFTLALIFTIRSGIRIFHLLTLSLMLASCDYLFLEIYRINPFMSVVNPDIDIAIILSLLVIVLNRDPYQQMLILSLVLLVGDTYFAYAHRSVSPMYLGNPRFLDKWWLTLFSARIGTAFIQSGYRVGKRTVKAWTERQKGWRE